MTAPRTVVLVVALIAAAHPLAAQPTLRNAESIRLRYLPPGPGEIVSSHVQNRNAFNLTQLSGEDRRPYHRDEIYLGVRLAQFDSSTGAGQRRITYTVLADETRSGDFYQQVQQHGSVGVYDVDVGSQGVAVSPRGRADSAAIERVRAFWSGQASYDAIGSFVASRGFTAGEWHELPPPVLAFLDAGEGHVAFETVEWRWHRRVARFGIRAGSVRQGGYALEITGALHVDSATGKPLQLSWTARGWNGDSAKVEGIPVRVAGVASAIRVWSYKSIPHTSHRVELVPQTTPSAPVRSLAASGDGRMLSILTADGQLAHWDTRLRRTTESRALDAMQLEYAGTLLFALDASGFMQNWLGGATGQAFGRSMRGVHIDSPRPIGFAMAGVYPLVAYPDGTLDLRNLGHDTISTRLRVSDRGLVAIATSADGSVLVTVDSTGQPAMHAIDGVAPGCDGDWRRAYCRTASIALRPVGGSLPRLPGASAVALSSNGSTLAAATAGGDVYVVRDASTFVFSGAGSHVAVSPDGATIFTERGRFAADGRDSLIFSGSASEPAPPEHSRIALSGDGEILFRTRELRGADPANSTVIELVDVRGGMVIDEIRSRVRPIVDATIAPLDGDVGVVVQAEAGSAAWGLGSLAVAPIPADPDTESQIGWRGSTRLQLGGARIGPTAAMEFVPGSSSRLYTLSPGGELRLWDTASGAEIFATRYAIEPPRVASGVHEPPMTLAVSPGGTRVAIPRARSRSGTWNPEIPVILLVDGRSGEIVRELVPRWGSVTAAAFSGDGESLVVGDADGRVMSYDVRSGEIASEFQAHRSAVTSIDFLPGDERFMTASLDASLRLWRRHDPGALIPVSSATLRPVVAHLDRPTHQVAALVVVDSTEHVAATADGYYAASRGALRGFALVGNGEAFDFERYDLWLNRPDVLLDRIGLAEQARRDLVRAATERRAAQSGRTVDLAEAMASPPQLLIASAGDRFTTGSQARVDLEASSAAAPLARLDIRVNSVPLEGTRGRALSGSSWKGSVSVPLGRGVNRIQISVTDSRGVESARQTMVVTRGGAPAKPDLYILAVGVSDYAVDRLDLTYASKDADDMIRLFSADTANFGRVHVHRIVDREATRARILAARSFLAAASVDDQVVVFFAGHGLLDRNLDYYFGTTDVDPMNPARAGVSYAQLVGLVDGIAARKRLLLLDTCHAGEVDMEAPPAIALAGPSAPVAQVVREFRGVGVTPEHRMATSSFELMREMFADLRAQSGATVLSAAGGAEFAMESARWSNGVFTYSVREALEQRMADVDSDGRITVEELERYVSQRVVELTNGGQSPTARQRNLDMNFVVR